MTVKIQQQGYRWLKGIAALLVGMALAFDAAGAIELSRMPGVGYSYVDEHGGIIAPEKFQDPQAHALNDGIKDKAVASIYRYSLRKTIRVLFHFPTVVTVDRADVIWMNGHDSRQWFDCMTLYAGDSVEALTVAGTVTTPPEHKRVTSVGIPLTRSATGRYFLVEAIQYAHPQHAMLSLGEISLWGTPAEAAKIKAATVHKLMIEPERHFPSNLFDVEAPVKIPVVVTGASDRTAIMLNIELIDYFGNIVECGQSKIIPGADGRGLGHVIFNELPAGYYRLVINGNQVIPDGAGRSGKMYCSFIVAPLTQRSAAEAKRAGNRFGITGHYSTPESRLACTRLGLSWNSFLWFFAPRAGNDPERPDFTSTQKMLDDYVVNLPANNFIQIKTVPSWCYDEKRFGKPGKDWSLKMPKNKEAFQRFIREQVKLLPAGPQVIKVWNEPWDTYTPEDYATLCNWIGEAAKQSRPDLLMGPNLGPMDYMAKFLEHDGMKYMDLLIVHPYSADFTSTPEAAVMRERLRAWRELLKQKTGRDYPLYVAEVGWPTPESGPNRNTEERQAYCMVRAGLAMAAEDIKAATFFCNGSPEKIKDYREDYFGVFRRSGDPKPALAALAAMNRMIEGAEFAGDINLGPDIGAMLFRRRDGRLMLALYADGGERKIFLRPGAATLTLVDVVGKETELKTKNNRLSLTLNDNPIYLVGVGSEWEKRTVSPLQLKWSKTYRRGERECQYVPSLPDAAGWAKLPVWKISSPEVDPAHLSAVWQVAWNEEFLFLHINVKDRQPGINPAEGCEIWKGDALELFVSTAPDQAIPGFLKDADHQLLISPFSASGHPVAVSADLLRRGQSITGLKTDYRVRTDGWEAVLALPFRTLKFIPKAGSRLALEALVDDLCQDHRTQRRSISSNGRKDNHTNAAVWSILTLKK